MEQDHQATDPIPVSLLTGFLGSGKTTVLNHLLRQPQLARTAVVINEFGEIGLDHELVQSSLNTLASTDNVVLLQSGCLCCTIRGDLVVTLHDLFVRRAREEIVAFDRLVIETTGLADPAPILHTLMTDGLLSDVFRFDGVITTVDAATGQATLDAQIEAVKQVAVADRLVLTKSDLVEPAAVRALERRLRSLNPGAPIFSVRAGAIEPMRLFGVGFYDLASKIPDVEAWLNAEAYQQSGDLPDHHSGEQVGHHQDDHDDHDKPAHPGHGVHGHASHQHDPNRHDARISAIAYTVHAPIPPAIFDLWLEALMLLRGPNVLRIKGIVNVEGVGAPFVLHGVQHIFHPPVRLDDWPSTDRRTRIVLIGRDLERDFIDEAFRFLGSASQSGADMADPDESRLDRSHADPPRVDHTHQDEPHHQELRP